MMSPRDYKEELNNAFQPAAATDVVPLSDRLRASWTRPLRTVETYWEAMRNGRNVPPRSEIDPRGIENALENAFIAERIAPTHARLRIGGRLLCDLMGMEVRGMPLSAMTVPVSRERLSHAVQAVFDTPARVEITLLAEKRLGKPALNGRMTLLPLADDFGDVSRILGCFVTDGPVGRAPRRFEIVQVDVTPMVTSDARMAAAPKPAPRKLGFGDPAPGFAHIDGTRRDPASQSPRQEPQFKDGPVPYLRLVANNAD